MWNPVANYLPTKFDGQTPTLDTLCAKLTRASPYAPNGQLNDSKSTKNAWAPFVFSWLVCQFVLMQVSYVAEYSLTTDFDSMDDVLAGFKHTNVVDVHQQPRRCPYQAHLRGGLRRTQISKDRSSGCWLSWTWA